MNSEELEQSLKAEFENHLSSVIAEIRQEAAEFQTKVQSDLEHQRARMDEAFQGFAERLEARGGALTGGFGELVSEHLKLARDEGAKIAATAYTEAEKIEAPAPSGSTGFGELNEAIADVSSKDSQSAILKSLVDHAAGFAPRGAFFIVKNEHFTGWRTFGENADDDAVRSINFSTSSDSILAAASAAMRTVEAGAGSHSGDSEFLGRLDYGSPERMVAIPLVARGRGVAVLYVDNGNQGGAVNREALEMLVRVAGMTVELLAAGQAPAQDEAVSAPAPAAEGSYQEGSFGETVPASEEVSYAAPVFAEEPATADVAASDDENIEEHSFEEESAPAFEEFPPAAEEPEPEVESAPEPQPEPEYQPQYETAGGGAMVFDSGGSIEPAAESPFDRAVSPFEPAAPIGGLAREIEPAVAQTAPTRSRLSDRNVDLPIEVPEEERRMHNDARRFARLLVSEIKLYNEKKVSEGRQAHDLYDRLKEAIDRSREMYDKRVQPPVAAKFDYFHYELVNSLAEGEDQRFGNGYPGATV